MTSNNGEAADFDFVLFYEHEAVPWPVEQDNRDWDNRELEMSEGEMNGPNDYPVFIAHQCGLTEWSISSISGKGISDAGDGAFLTIPRRAVNGDQFLCLARFAKSPFVNFVIKDPINAQTY